MNNQHVVEDEENKVTFVPPLFLQRRSWVLNIIRRESVKSVLDIGCGDGGLLSCLVNPASSLLPSTKESTYLEDSEEIHLTKLGGLDIDASELEWAVKAVSPTEDPERSGWFSRHPRWEPLDAEIWHSSFENINKSLCWNDKGVGYECIVSTEVIEHLPPDVFLKFAPVVLGEYRPRLLLLTTPNYTYNTRFRAADSSNGVDEDAGGYPDPTNRTNRVFRHHDHKFEWTTEEFTEWCEAEAEKYGYDVIVDGVGRCLEGGDVGLGFASQTALFHRRPTSKIRLPVYEEASTPSTKAEDKVPLLSTTLDAHPSAGKPLPYTEILAIIKSVFESWNASQMTIQELWTERKLSTACGGLTEHILNAIRGLGDSSDKWTINDEGRKWEVSIHWGSFVRKGSWIQEGANEEEFELEEEFERSVVISEGWDEEETQNGEENGNPLERSHDFEEAGIPDNEIGSWSVLSSHSGWGAELNEPVNWSSQTWSDSVTGK